MWKNVQNQWYLFLNLKVVLLWRTTSSKKYYHQKPILSKDRNVDSILGKSLYQGAPDSWKGFLCETEYSLLWKCSNSNQVIFSFPTSIVCQIREVIEMIPSLVGDSFTNSINSNSVDVGTDSSIKMS